MQIIIGPQAELIANAMQKLLEGQPTPQPVESPVIDSASSGLAQTYLNAIGGAANVNSIDANATRLRLTLKDASKVIESAARQAGAKGVIRLGTQNVQIIVGENAGEIARSIEKLLQTRDANASESPMTATIATTM